MVEPYCSVQCEETAVSRPEDALSARLTDEHRKVLVLRVRCCNQVRWNLPARPLRVLITGDVANEGVNLHKQCHHLVHVDIPWSPIRIEQRNGRIDRYGQLYPPRIVALALTTTDERFSGDVRVLIRLLAKEHAAHTALGDAASLRCRAVRLACGPRPLRNVLHRCRPGGRDDHRPCGVQPAHGRTRRVRQADRVK